MKEPDRIRKLTELRATYLVEIDDEIARFRECLARAEGGASGAATWREMDRIAHNWKGSGGSYGFPAWSAAAAAIEHALKAGAPYAEVRRRFERALLVRAGLCSDLGER
jgi:HPt (histidine-containing phosphotransfer) domain-containing protein